MAEDGLTNQLDPAATGASAENSRDGAAKRRDPNEPVAVVGLGASAGGVAPLQQFFADMNPESGLAFVVVMHLSPELESQLPSVLQQKTKMPVLQVTESVKVQPNHVYVIPPNHQLTFEDSTLCLLPAQPASWPAGHDRSFFSHTRASLRPPRGLRHHVGRRLGWCDRVETHSRPRRRDDRAGSERSGIRQHAWLRRSRAGWSIGCCRWRRWRRS